MLNECESAQICLNELGTSLKEINDFEYDHNPF